MWGWLQDAVSDSRHSLGWELKGILLEGGQAIPNDEDEGAVVVVVVAVKFMAVSES